MTNKHNHHLEAVAGCIEFLSDKPDCKTACTHLMKVLRIEQLKLETTVVDFNQERIKRTGVSIEVKHPHEIPARIYNLVRKIFRK